MSKEVMKRIASELRYYNPLADKYKGEFIHKVWAAEIEVALAKQEQGEPVAMEKVYETIIHWDESGGKRSRRELARRIEALYTTQQRKPLTGEQAAQILEAERCWLSNETALRVARAIEAAHGITSETDYKE